MVIYEPITIDKINNLILSNNDTLELIDNKKDHIFPSALSSNNNHKVQVGHVRKDYSLPCTIYFKPGLFNLLKYKVTIEPTI